MEKINIREIINEDFQINVQEPFAHVTGFGVVFTDKEGNHIGEGSNFCDLCKLINETEEGKNSCAKFNKKSIKMALLTNKPSIYICHAGLVNIEIPLIVNGIFIGAATAGQVLPENPEEYPNDNLEILSPSNNYSFSVKQYESIPIVSKNKVEACAGALGNIANYVVNKYINDRMKEKISERERQLLEKEILEKSLQQELLEIKLIALQKQITPHFMFNILSTISRLLELEDYETSKSMLDSFVAMAKFQYSQQNVLIPIKEEMEYINAYLNIQKIRFSERLSFNIYVDKKIESLLIPLFTIQPLVENAIEHGALKKRNGGKVNITVCNEKSLDGERISIQIEDDGDGIPPEELKKINQKMILFKENNVNLFSEKIGILSVYQRLQLIYPSHFDFDIISDTYGTKIIIKIDKIMLKDKTIR